jgi:hypothetical protein
MARVKFSRENPPDANVIKGLEEHEVDCEASEDKEAEEPFRFRAPEDLLPGMSA